MTTGRADLTAADARPPSRALEGAIAGAVIVGAYAAFRMAPAFAVPGAFNDDGAYLATGKAIESGVGYRSLHLVGDPVQAKFPPALPLLLAVLWRVTGSLAGVTAAAYVLDLLAIGGSAALLWWIGRERLGLRAEPLAIFAIGPLLLDASIQYFTLTLAEPYYLLLWAASLALCLRLTAGNVERGMGSGEQGEGNRSNAHTSADDTAAIALGLTLALGALFRTQAIVLVPAFVGVLLWARRSRAALLSGLAAAAPLALWAIWRARLVSAGPLSSAPDDSAYLAWLPRHSPAGLATFATDVVELNVSGYLTVFSTYLSRWSSLGLVLCLAAAALAMVGARTMGRRAAGVWVGVLATVGLLLLWPSPQDRLLIPVLPMAGLLMAAGATALARPFGLRAKRVLLGLAMAATLMVGVRQVEMRQGALRSLSRASAPAIRSPSYFLPRNSRLLVQLSAWLNDHSAASDRVLVSMAPGVFLLTGLKTVASAPTESRLAVSVFAVPGRFLAHRILEEGVSLVVVEADQGPVAEDVAAVQRRCPRALVYAGSAGPGQFPAFFRVVPDAVCLRSFLPTETRQR